MKIIDAHCDALWKLQLAKRGETYDIGSLSYQNSNVLHTNVKRLKEGNVMVQLYAVFIEPHIPSDEKWQHALEQIDLFYTEVIGKSPEIKHIKKWSEIDDLKDGEIGTILTLEGADAVGNDLGKMRHLYRLGVLSVGLTWNNANLCADGVEEPRGGGLTLLGKEVVKLNNEYKVFTDVAHASLESFWDIMKLAKYPIASHSNARKICDHPRNLYDNQIESILEKQGLIHVVFFPPFVKEDSDSATISDLIKHIDHICSLGGVKQIGFGSDFDGINRVVSGIENSAKYPNLINELLKHFSEEEVKGFAYKNFLNHRPK